MLRETPSKKVEQQSLLREPLKTSWLSGNEKLEKWNVPAKGPSIPYGFLSGIHGSGSFLSQQQEHTRPRLDLPVLCLAPKTRACGSPFKACLVWVCLAEPPQNGRSPLKPNKKRGNPQQKTNPGVKNEPAPETGQLSVWCPCKL